MKLVFLIVVVLCVWLPEAFGLNCPITTKAPISCAPKVTTKVPTTCAPKTTKAPTTCAQKTTKAPTTCAPKSTKAPTTCAPKPTTKAPLPVCGTNEVYSECGATGCVNTCAKPTFAQISRCACKPGCICIDGYLRNSKNVCVAPQQCDTCKENEEFSACDAHGCRNTCAEPDLLLRCTYLAGCYPGCICKEGFLKNADGVCVPEATCVNQCPNPNESYNTCGTACPKTCENKDKEIFCTFQCVTGCFCNDGYVRDANGVCILPESCPKTCPENEVYNECGTACPKTCKTKDAMIKCTADCNAACFCQQGYIRDITGGKCIPERDCPLVCGPNQIINECPPCPAGQTCPKICIPRCECMPGYIFDTAGTCIKVTTTCAPKTTKAPTTCAPKTTKAPTTCAPKTTTKAPEPVCGSNEVYSECGATGCVNTCAKPTFAQISRCACKPGCICIDGYLRNSKNVCVAPEQCDTCKENEEFSACGAHSCRNTCAEPDLLPRCTTVAGCFPGCICKEGFLENADGVCVPKATCVNQCPNPNESYNTCGTACPKTCENKDKEIFCTFQCVTGCFCNDGYVRDANGVCILPESCPKTCPENEVYNECGTACPKTCKTKDAMIKCSADCNAACFCQQGYIRDVTGGKCIPERDCPLVCGPNQVINECPPCPKGQICAAVCIPRCECIPGYIFGTAGTCTKVTTTCAPKTTKKPTTCAPKTTKAPTTCAPKTTKAPTKCAPIKTKAPTTCAKKTTTKVCGTNEVYSECGATACVNTCANPTFAQVSRCSCKPGCICIDGYLRNSKNVCVAPQQCALVNDLPPCPKDPKKSDNVDTYIPVVKECKKPLPVPLPVPEPVSYI